MFEFAPLIFLVLIWLLLKPLMGLQKTSSGSRNGRTRGTAARKAAAVRGTENTQAWPGETGEATTAASSEGTAGTWQETEEPVTMRPDLAERRPFDRDETLYRGSMDAVTGEGEDPCHEEQMENLRPEPELETGAPAGGLDLRWTGNEIVKGLVMSEVLRRRS